MRLLICSIYFAPDLTGIAKYSGDMAAWLAEQGHSVRVIAAPPYYPNWKRQPEYASLSYRREIWRNVTVWRAPLWVPKSPGGLTRILHFVSFAITSFPLMMRQAFWRPNVVMTVAPAFVCAPAGWLAARLCGAQAWLHIQDFEIDVAFGMGMLKGKFLQRAVFAFERWLLRRFDRVSSISNRMVDLLVKKGVPGARTNYFPNWVDTSCIVPSVSNNSFRKQLGIEPAAVVVLFSGSLGAKQGLLIIPAVAALLARREDIVFVICGDGVMKPRLEASVANLPNVRMLPLQPVERLGELLSMADIHLLPQRPGAADLVLPSKLSGMLASGRPVIAMCEVGTEIDAVVSQCGVVVPPEDGLATAEAIIRLTDDSVARLQLGRCARVWAEEHFERNAVLARNFRSLESEKKAEAVYANGTERAKAKVL